MNLSIQEELRPFAEKLQRYITPEFLEKLAREMKFVKRKRKFSGSDLATIFIWISQRVCLIMSRLFFYFKKTRLVIVFLLLYEIFHP